VTDSKSFSLLLSASKISKIADILNPPIDRFAPFGAFLQVFGEQGEGAERDERKHDERDIDEHEKSPFDRRL
jgi:hypothetical protein